MLVLSDMSQTTPVDVYVSPDNIGHMRVANNGRTAIVLRDGNLLPCIAETPMVISRMRAAWDARFLSSQVHANNWLPIAITADDKHGFRFVCCAYTDEKVQAKRASLSPGEQPVPTVGFD